MQIQMEPEAVREQQGKLWNSLVKFDRASCEVCYLPVSPRHVCLCLRLLLMLPLVPGSSGKQERAWLAASDKDIGMELHLESSMGVEPLLCSQACSCTACRPACCDAGRCVACTLCCGMLIA